MSANKSKSKPKRITNKRASGGRCASLCSAGWFIVSVVVIKDIITGINTQNKLYAIKAVSSEEAHGKVISSLAADFTVCSYAVDSLPNNSILDPKRC